MDHMKEFPSLLTPGKFYFCFHDICQEGLQFCNVDISGRRCEYCNAHFYDCFTYHQQVNCTQYCMDQWKQNNSEVVGVEQKVDVFKILFFVLFGICCLTVSTTFVICFSRIHKIILSKLQGRAVGRSQRTLVGQVVRARRQSVTLPTVPNTLSGTCIFPPAAQDNVVGNVESNVVGRQEGEGSSHTERRSESRHTGRRSEISRNASSGTPTSSPSSNTDRKECVNLQNRSVTDLKMIYNNREEKSPNSNSSTENAHLLVNNLKADSAMNGSRAIPPSGDSNGYHALRAIPPSDHSNGYHALPHTSEDTGYRTAST